VCALAAGLGALLVLERGGRRADPFACFLLVLSIAFVEVGIAFVAAVGVSILIRPDRWRRIWIVVVPLVLFGAWYLWAQRFEIEPVGLGAAGDLPESLFDSLRAVLASLTGRIPTGDDAAVPVVGLTTCGAILAGITAVLFAVRLRRGPMPPTIWPLLTALLVYWIFLGLAERAPDSSRYVFAGAVLLLLVAADALRDRRPGALALGLLAGVVALSVPWNVAKLQDGGDYLAQDAKLTRGEFAMLELAGERADPEYRSAFDFQSRGVGSSPYLVMTPPDYFDAAARIGSLADPLDEIRGEDIFLRTVDDVVLARALALGIEPAAAPPDERRCVVAEQVPGAVQAPPQGLLVQALEPDVALALSRFATDFPALQMGRVAEGDWVRVSPPGTDAAPEPWRVFYDGRIRACTLAG
jgi:hypothetical protein